MNEGAGEFLQPDASSSREPEYHLQYENEYYNRYFRHIIPHTLLFLKAKEFTYYRCIPILFILRANNDF
jgi:hypothetical protein